MPPKITLAYGEHNGIWGHMDEQGIYGHMGAYRHMGGVGVYRWNTDAPYQTDIPTCLTTPTCLPLNEGKISLFKAKLLHLKSWKNNSAL